MNEGKGDMIRIARAVMNGSIKEDVLKDICEDNNWEYKFNNKYCMIFPKLIKRK